MDSYTSDIKKPVPLLTRGNHDEWFEDMTNWLISKDVGWVIKDDIEGISTPESSTTSQTSQHSPTYAKANATALYWMGLCITRDDKAHIREFKKAKDAWESLEKKYRRRLGVTARHYQLQYATYRMEEDTQVDEA